MVTLLFAVAYLLISFTFYYFIEYKKGTRASFIAKIILSELILLICHFILTMAVENFSLLMLLLVFSIIVILLSPYFASLPLPEITYSYKLAPLMVIISGIIIFVFSDLHIKSIIIATSIFLFTAPLTFADHDYEVKLNKIKIMPDIFETTPEERKEIYIQQQKEIEDLNKSYRRNIFVRFIRNL